VSLYKKREIGIFGKLWRRSSWTSTFFFLVKHLARIETEGLSLSIAQLAEICWNLSLMLFSTNLFFVDSTFVVKIQLNWGPQRMNLWRIPSKKGSPSPWKWSS
jgi:hypothetical protein